MNTQWSLQDLSWHLAQPGWQGVLLLTLEDRSHSIIHEENYETQRNS